MVKTLTERGVSLDVLTGKPNYPAGQFYPGYSCSGFSRENFCGANVYRVPVLPRGRKGALRLTLNYLSFIFSALLFSPWLLRGRNYDVIFVYGVSPIFQAVPALLLRRIKKCPLIIWVQDLWPESLKATGYVNNAALLSLVGRCVSYVYRGADLLLVQSKAFLPFVSALASGKAVAYYPNSVDDTFVAASSVNLPEIAALDCGFPVVFAGNIGVGQAVEVIVEAAILLKNHPEIRFVIVGDGSRRDWMVEQVKSREIANLHLPGRFPVETMPGLMRKAGALLVSLADEPIFAATVPNKLQAYLASGRPILASLDGEGARLIREAGAGLTSPAGDAAALAQAVLDLFQMSAAERDALGANGRRYFRDHFDHQTLTDQLLKHIDSASQTYKAGL